jgi:hypothetical protein
MLFLKYASLRINALLVVSLGFASAAGVRDAPIPGPTAIASNAAVNYCFARVRGLDPGRLPPAYLVLRLQVSVSYHNSAPRPVILPVEHERTIYTALTPGPMSVFKQGLGLLDPVLKVMKELPPDVSPDSPIIPKNDVFTVIPAGGDMSPPLSEEVIIPVSRKGFFRKYPDLRGKRVYVKLRFLHREMAAPLEAQLSDRWSGFGVPWTGTLTTNTILIDVPAAPEAGPCKDLYVPAHGVAGLDDHTK